MIAKSFTNSKKEGVSPEVFLGHIGLSSVEHTALKSKTFRNFSVISASWSLFLRFWVGCAIAHKAKEKPLEYCVIPTVYVVAEWWSRCAIPTTPRIQLKIADFSCFCFSAYPLWHIFTRIFFEKNGEEMGQNPLFRGKNGEEMGKFFEVVNQPSDSEIITAIVSLNRPT